ncbi:MAG TPA: hypothetical protein VNQ79_06630 [Blastocatellia bacterium]|nr:hypothetical protein [Blastocatellia bacterium]
MALAKLDITPLQVTMRTGTQQNFSALASGRLALIDNDVPTWQNLDNCGYQPDGSLRKLSNTVAWDAGATSVETISAGDGQVAWVANVPPADPAISYPEFGGRQFFAGLTRLEAVSTYTELDFALQVFQGGVVIFESGVQIRNARAPRNNGIYQVGIENGQVVYRADGDVIHRSSQAITYPLRFGAVFFNPLDAIGGDPDDGVVTWEARRALSSGTYGSWSSQTGNSIWTAPAQYGLYTITARTANNVIGQASAHVLRLFPREEDGLPKPAKFRELSRTWRVNEQVYDDESADYNLPYEHEGVRRFRLEWNSRTLSPSQADLIDSFWQAHKTAIPFYFYNWRTGETVDNVRFAKEPEVDHRKVWRQQRVVELIRRPL